MLPTIIDVRIADDTLSVDLDDGRTISVPIGFYPRLARATSDERKHFVISGAGFGIHWPALDEDLGVEGLLQGRRSTENAESLKRWLGRTCCDLVLCIASGRLFRRDQHDNPVPQRIRQTRRLDGRVQHPANGRVLERERRRAVQPFERGCIQL